MPNNAVFNFDPASLRTKIFGSQDSAILTDANGRLEIRGICDSVTITATNLDIRDLTAFTDNILIYGFDGTTVKSITTDTSGRLEIRGICDSVTVTATNLDIRDLTAFTDNILIYGFDGTTVKSIITDTNGRLEVRGICDSVTVTGTLNTTPTFSENSTTNIASGDNFTGLSYLDTATQTMYTFFVYNKGPNSADVRLDVSADQNTFFTDLASRTLATGATDTFIAKSFLRYTRIAYKSTAAGNATTLDVFFQKQSN